MLPKLNAAKIALCLFLLGYSSTLYAQTPIFLTSSERDAVWHSLGKWATRTSIPAGLHVGEAVPDTMRLFAFSRRLRHGVPPLRSYSYALSHGEVLIVDRRTRKIVSIVSD